MSKSDFFKKAKQAVNEWLPLRYFRELSVVIIGVAVTFYLSGLISASNERKDLNLYLDAIRSELAYNLDCVDSLSVHYNDHIIFRQLLLDYSKVPQKSTLDSIDMYSQVYNGSNTFTYKKAAYEMFINSGAMKTLNDKQLLLDITESYILLETLYVEHEKHTELKFKQFAEIYALIDLQFLKENISILHPAMRRLYNFHALNSGLYKLVDKVKAQLEKTLDEKK